MVTLHAGATESERPLVNAYSEGFSGYPDCRRAFFNVFQNVIDVGTNPETEIELKARFVEQSKAEIAERRLEHGVPYEMT